MLEGLLLVFASLLGFDRDSCHMLVVVGDQLLEKDQRHERANNWDAVLLHNLVLVFALFDQVCDETLSILLKAALLVFEFALLTQNIDVAQCLLNLSNLALESEGN